MLDESKIREILKSLNFKEDLVIAVVRDWKTKEILMVAYQNKEAVEKTLQTGLMHYWSRSRKKLWMKGETSGHHQLVKRIFLDCDGDTLLYDVEQEVAACHEGYYSCFYRVLENGEWKVFRKRKFDPAEKYAVYKKS